ncbi:hypothetical protein Agub_g9676, partial [Astrephomene gubernaculifera]
GQLGWGLGGVLESAAGNQPRWLLEELHQEPQQQGAAAEAFGAAADEASEGNGGGARVAACSSRHGVVAGGDGSCAGTDSSSGSCSGSSSSKDGCSSSNSSSLVGAAAGTLGSIIGPCQTVSERTGVELERLETCQEQQQQQQQEQPAGLLKPWHGLAAGGVAGFAQVFLWSPVELLKLRSQLQTATRGSPGYRNPAALAAQVVRTEGVVGLYRGFTLTLVRDVPSFAMYFWLYHDIATALSPGMHPEEAPPATQVIAGGMAGVLAWMPIYPLDVLKTRVQAVPGSSAGGGGGGKTMLQYAREMYSEAGVRSFYRGVSPTLVRAFLMDAAAFLGYSTTLKLLGG